MDFTDEEKKQHRIRQQTDGFLKNRGFGRNGQKLKQSMTNAEMSEIRHESAQRVQEIQEEMRRPLDSHDQSHLDSIRQAG